MIRYAWDEGRVIGVPSPLILNVTSLNYKQLRRKVWQYANMYELDIRNLRVEVMGFWSTRSESTDVRYFPDFQKVKTVTWVSYVIGTNFRVIPMPHTTKRNNANTVSLLRITYSPGSPTEWYLSNAELRKLLNRGFLSEEQYQDLRRSVVGQAHTPSPEIYEEGPTASEEILAALERLDDPSEED